ncbi:MAG: Ldh family oxidoreductase, partial [Acidimicrobiales bacterium]|nr:Ldh family oxidoreductase [Acidimicrobiales bacterium]
MADAAADVTVVTADRLRAHEEAILGALGVPADQAAIVADNLVEADLRGVESHGAHLLELYVARLRSGHLHPVTTVTTVRDDGSTVLLDGGLGFGQVAGVAAMGLAIERAKQHGTAAITVKESTHLGALAYYTQRAAEAGCFAMAFQNGPTIVPPYGGRSGIFSTNPFSYAVPAGEEHPIVYDIATTAVAGNKILLAKKRGDATIPEGWACDEMGRPTTDTQAASTFNLQWFGGYKGFGIAMLVELLAGVLADSCYGTTENTGSELHGRERIAKGYLFLVLDVNRFLPLDVFRQRVDELIRDVRRAERADGVDRIYVPGEIEHGRR